MKRWLIAGIAGFLFLSAPVMAQNDQMCRAITAILRDVPNGFKNVRGRMIESGFNMTTWHTSVKVPHVVSERFVQSMGLFYEGAFAQSRNVKDLGPYYERLREILAGCLAPMGYTATEQDHVGEGEIPYKKIVYMKEPADGEAEKTLPPHVALEAIYNKQVGLYTLVLYIFDK